MDAFNVALRQAQQWLNRSNAFDRQRLHLLYHPAPNELPPESILVAQQLFDAPLYVATDEDLDAVLDEVLLTSNNPSPLTAN